MGTNLPSNPISGRITGTAQPPPASPPLNNPVSQWIATTAPTTSPAASQASNAPATAPAPTPGVSTRGLLAPPTVTKAPQDTTQPIRRYQPAFPGEKIAGYEPIPGKFRTVGRAIIPQVRPYYEVPVDKRSGLERAVDSQVTPLLAKGSKFASPALTVPAKIAGDTLAQLGGGPALVAAAHDLHKGNALGAGVQVAGLLPFGKLGRLAGVAKTAEDAVAGGKAVQTFQAAKTVALRTPEEAQAHLLDAAAQARAEGFGAEVGSKGHPPLVPKGVATPETGGELGQRVREAMLSAPSIRNAQKEAQSGERLDRVKAAAQARIQAGGGSAGQAAAKLHLAGEYGQEFFHHLKDIQPAELEQLKRLVDQAPLQEFERTHAIDALDAAVLRGVVPQKHDQAILERVFGRVDNGAPDEVKTAWQKFSSGIASALNVPRALRAATDLGSAGFRQSLVTLVTHPAIFWRNWVKTFPAVVSPKFYEDWMQKTVYDRPTYPLMLKYGVPFTEHGTTLKSAPIGRTEESYIGANAAEHLNLREIPGLHGLGKLGTGPGDLVSATGRGFTGFQNAVRAELFDQMAHAAMMTGRESLDEVVPSKFGTRLPLGESIARVAGAFTGRGVMPKQVERRFVTVTSTMFSPRLMASRLNLLSPVYYYKLDPFARAEAIRGVRNLVISVGTMMYVAKLLGASVTFDPRSSNFGKVKIGNTRVDLTGGFNQYIRLYAQEMTREEISSSGHHSHIGWGQHSISDLANVTKLLRSKQAPVTGFLWDELSGKDFLGQPVKQSTEVRGLVVPFAIDDALRANKLSGPAAAVAAAFLSAIGLSVQTYKDKPPRSYGNGGGGSGFGDYSGGFGGSDSGFGDSSGGGFGQ